MHGWDGWGRIMTLNHVLLTRFNLPSAGFESVVRAQEGWLKNRTHLFEKYCLSSVRAQTNKNFHWIIYFDPESPEWLKEKIREWSADRIFEPIFRPAVSYDELICDIRRVVGSPGTELMTTNLDNDDGIAIDFVHRLQETPRTSTRNAIYIADGLIKAGKCIYLQVDKKNAFCSVREGWSSPVGCWVDFHEHLGQHMPVIVLRGEPAWLQVVHGSNVSNRVRGGMVSVAQYQGLFPRVLCDVAEPSMIDFLHDLLVGRPTRLLKETARRAVKILVREFLGRTGADRVKLAWATYLRRH